MSCTKLARQGLEGGCACGTVRYQLRCDPLVVHACHCQACQRQSGSWHAVNALIEAHNVTLLHGEVCTGRLATPTGAGQTITRCKHCSVAVWSDYHAFSRGLSDTIWFIRVGTLDQPELLPPDVHIFTRYRNKAAPLPNGAPAYPAFYELPEVWQSDSLKRLTNLIDSAQAS